MLTSYEEVMAASDLAFNLHEHQKYGNKAYYEGHLIPVWKTTQQFFEEDLQLEAVALLHDILEDTDVTENELRRLGFSDVVIEAVVAITKLEGEDWQSYLARIAANSFAWKVKIADTKCNLEQCLVDGDWRRAAYYSQRMRDLLDLKV